VSGGTADEDELCASRESKLLGSSLKFEKV
jgi:hypothetical protein